MPEALTQSVDCPGPVFLLPLLSGTCVEGKGKEEEKPGPYESLGGEGTLSFWGSVLRMAPRGPGTVTDPSRFPGAAPEPLG